MGLLRVTGLRGAVRDGEALGGIGMHGIGSGLPTIRQRR
jgi:hypothetical protein